MNLSIQNLRIFLAVVEEGSLTAASRSLYMSQPSVSASVRSLETALAAQLLDRGPAGANPTPAGAVLADHARRILGILSHVDADVAKAQGLADQKLSVAGTSTLGSYLLPRVLSRFLADHTDIRTELRVGNAEKVADLIINKEVSIAICAGKVEHEQLVCSPILDEALVLAASRAHPLAGIALTPPDLSGERFLQREIGSSTRTDQDAALQEWGLADVQQWTIWSGEAARESVRAGLGVALISEHVIAQDLRSGALVRLNISPPPPRRPVTLVHMANRSLTPLELDFVQLLSSIKNWPLA